MIVVQKLCKASLITRFITKQHLAQILCHCDSCTKRVVQRLFKAGSLVLPVSYQSNIVYQFLCLCDSQYVGRTSQRVQQRIKQHVLETIFQGHISQDRSTLARYCKPIRSLKAETSSPLWHNISYKTLHAHVNTMITNFSFLSVAVLLFISPPLKQLTSKHPN